MNGLAELEKKGVGGEQLTKEQKHYLDGFFSGAKQKAFFSELIKASPSVPSVESEEKEEEILILEERIKREEHPLDSFYRLVDNSKSNKAPEKEEVFRFKWNGLFWLNPVKDGYMCRMRIPGGKVTSFQLREIARISNELTTGYIQITTRANFQIRLIQPKDAPEVLRRIQSVGLHSKGAGADNIRNITANPTAGVDPCELIDVRPFVDELASFIISHQEFYDLPRKFNIAFDGGGVIGSVEDTNDIGIKAFEMGENAKGIAPGIYFRIKLGGATGLKSFAQDIGVLVKQEELLKVVVALVRVFIKNGNRTNRKKARLKYLLEQWGNQKYLEETEKLLGYELIRSPFSQDKSGLESFEGQIKHRVSGIPHSHVGNFPQKQKGLQYVGPHVPIGELKPDQLLKLADLVDQYGSGEIALTVWQNFVIPNVEDKNISAVIKGLKKIGFSCEQSNVSSGFVACTGNQYCKFSSTNTKKHARELIGFLEKRVELDRPINVHLTGCPHSCAQHYMADIGLLGTKVKQSGESVEGYHVFVGGGFAEHQALGRQIFTGIAFDELKELLEKMIRGYLRNRQSRESFQEFTSRYELNELQAIFSNEE